MLILLTSHLNARSLKGPPMTLGLGCSSRAQLAVMGLSVPALVTHTRRYSDVHL